MLHLGLCLGVICELISGVACGEVMTVTGVCVNVVRCSNWGGVRSVIWGNVISHMLGGTMCYMWGGVGGRRVIAITYE